MEEEEEEKQWLLRRARGSPRPLDPWRPNLLLGFQRWHHQQHRLLALEAAGGKRTYLRT